MILQDQYYFFCYAVVRFIPQKCFSFTQRMNKQFTLVTRVSPILGRVSTTVHGTNYLLQALNCPVPPPPPLHER